MIEMNAKKQTASQDDQTDPLLQQASRLNSDLRRFVRTGKFSSQLSGRFYQNNSMETHTAREQQISRLKEKRKKLERDVKTEDAKIKYLKKLLQLKEANQRATALQQRQYNAAAKVLQTFIRFCQAKNKLELLKVERNITIYVALFLQSSYRGMKDRVKVESLKSIKRKSEEEATAAMRIQHHARCFMARRLLIQMRRQMKQSINLAACKIQAVSRSSICRAAINRKRQMQLEYHAATKIQTCYRGYSARRIALLKRQLGRKRKPEKISLPNRRYSTYSVKVDHTCKNPQQSECAMNCKDHKSRAKSQNQRKNILETKQGTKAEVMSSVNKTVGTKENKQLLATQQLAQQNAYERVTALGQRVRQEKKKRQLDSERTHCNLKQLEENCKGMMSSSHRCTNHAPRPVLSESTKCLDPNGTDDFEFDEWVAESENDLD